MPYYNYTAWCEQCGKDMGLVEQFGGPMRRYCSDACKQKAYRDRKRAEGSIRNVEVLRFEAYAKKWLGHAQADRLVSLAVEFGLPAAKKACEIAIRAAAEVRRMSLENPSVPLQIDLAIR